MYNRGPNFASGNACISPSTPQLTFFYDDGDGQNTADVYSIVGPPRAMFKFRSGIEAGLDRFLSKYHIRSQNVSEPAPS